MIRVLVAERDSEARRRILSQLAAEEDVEVIAVCEDMGTSLNQLELLRPDVLFVQAEMAQSHGLGVLVAPNVSKRPYIVVTAGSGRYAIEAFDVNAVDYLLEPVDSPRLGRALTKVRQNIDRDSRCERKMDVDSLVRYLKQQTERATDPHMERIPVNFGGRMRFLNAGAILYMETDADYVNIHMTTGEVLHSTNRISEMAQKLPAERFLRIRRSTIVNIEHVREARAHKDNYEVVMDNGKSFRPGSTYKLKIKSALI